MTDALRFIVDSSGFVLINLLWDIGSAGKIIKLCGMSYDFGGTPHALVAKGGMQ
jgi:hypothetical protein